MTNLLHGILHKFVYIPVVFHSILVVKITAESEHNVFRSIIAGLKENIFDEGIHSFIHIVIHQVRVVLKWDYARSYEKILETINYSSPSEITTATCTFTAFPLTMHNLHKSMHVVNFMAGLL